MSDLKRRRAEERAFQLAAIVDSCPDAIIEMTLEGTITSWNRGGQTIYGYSPEEAIGQPLAMLAPSDRPREIPQILARVARGEVGEQHETIRIHKDGTPVAVSVTASPIRDSAGR